MIASVTLWVINALQPYVFQKTGEVRYVNRIILVVVIRLDDIGRQIISHANKYFGIFRCKRLLISELSPNDTHLW